MSNPQIEDGYTRIANELLDAIVRFDFSKRQYAVLFAVIRKTYGYNKKSDALSVWQIASMTGIDRSHCSKAVAELCALNILIKSNEGRMAHGQTIQEISINKFYKNWLTCAKTAQVNTDAETAPVPKQHLCQNSPQTDAETATPPVPKQLHHLCQNSTHIKTTSKDNSKRHTKDTDSEYPESFNLAWESYPKRTGANKKLAFSAWNARIKSGTLPDVIQSGVLKYAKYCEASGTEDRFIKQAQSFFGPNEHYLSDWTPIAQARGSPNYKNDERMRVANEIWGKQNGTNNTIQGTAQRMD